MGDALRASRTLATAYTPCGTTVYEGIWSSRHRLAFGGKGGVGTDHRWPA